MRSKIVPVKNIARLSTAADALIHRAHGNPGMGLVHGETGYGKTTAVTWLINKTHGVYVRALASWTPSAMLKTICEELEIEPRGGAYKMVQDIVEGLTKAGRPLYVDEADYLVKSTRMTETLRDIHDMATSPVVLIGMAGIDRRLSHRKQLTGRILQDVHFHPADAEDARLLADHLCEVKVRDDLLDRVHRQCRGSVRLIVVSLSRIEGEARARNLGEIGLKEWGKGDFFTGDAPNNGAGNAA